MTVLNSYKRLRKVHLILSKHNVPFAILALRSLHDKMCFFFLFSIGTTSWQPSGIHKRSERFKCWRILFLTCVEFCQLYETTGSCFTARQWSEHAGLIKPWDGEFVWSCLYRGETKELIGEEEEEDEIDFRVARKRLSVPTKHLKAKAISMSVIF